MSAIAMTADTTVSQASEIETTRPFFSVRDMHAYYGESYIVQGVSLDVRRGEILALLGRNGAGKTSTLRTIARTDNPQMRQGEIWLDGAPVHQMKSFEAARAGIQRLVALIRHHEWSFDYDAPDVLIVSPPPLCETGDPIFSAMFQGGIEQSSMLASLYRDLADELGCGFFDAGSVAKTSPLDGVHLTAEDTRAIGRGLEPIVRMMLGI